MKYLLAPLACLLLAPLSAQTIQYGNVSPFGIEAEMYLQTGNAPLQLSDGPGQTWNLSALPLQASGTLAFAPAAGTPYTTDHPAANWVWHQTVTGMGDVYQYLAINPGGVELVARNVPMNPVAYSDPLKILQFPMDFGASFTDTYTNGDGSGTQTWTYSGHGTLVTSMGTFPNLAKLSGSGGDTALWNLDPVYPVMIQSGSTVTFYKQTNVGVAEQVAHSLEVWPNPCADKLTVAGAAPGSAWCLLDHQGRVVGAGKWTAAERQVDVRDLAAGSYVLQLGSGTFRQSVRFFKN
ncbi:MAG TPA: hypothetical protein PLY76_07445 [Flavobacteriales bacterium]|nr:hypothetical protein [Flavobacteriales bacterium]HRP81718.1 hypothetical protein [Flavobacteriales bacterium]